MEKGILEEIETIKSKIEKFGRDVLRSFESFNPKSDEFSKWKDEMEKIYLRKLLDEIDHTIKVISSPVFVGLIGRYSHGKSALLNSLFDLRDELSLPEGEGVVTSKIIRVDFDKNIASPRAVIVKRNNEEEEVDLEYLKKLAGSTKGSSIDPTLIDYLYLTLPPTADFQKLFSKKNISLIDMPGIGGPYFNDTIVTQEYLSNLDFMLVTIKITEIDKAGSALERFIGNLQKVPPIICVFTFYDIAKEYSLFSELEDEDIQQKALELTEKEIPSLSKYLSRSIFVSSKTGLNIEQLRELILNLVVEKKFAIDKISQKTPEVFKRKVQEAGRGLNKLSKSIDEFLKAIDTSITGSWEKHKGGRVFKDTKGKFQREIRSVKREVKIRIRDLRREVEGIVNKILSCTDESCITNTLEEVEIRLSNALREIQDETKSFFKDQILFSVKQEALNFVKKSKLPASKAEELEENIENVAEYFEPDIFCEDVLDKVKLKSADVEIIMAKGKDLAKRIWDAILGDPRSWGFLIGAVILLVLSSKISFIGGILKLIGFGLFVVPFVTVLINPKSNVHFEQSKRDIYNKAKNQVENFILELERCFEQSIEEEIRRVQEDFEKAIMNELDETFKDFDRLDRVIVKEIKHSADELKESLHSVSRAILNLL